MRRHSKASAVRSTLDISAVRFGGTVATGGASGDFKGSGAPSAGSRRALLSLAITALFLLVFVPLAQAKIVVNGFGLAGASGGQFGSPRGIAVNNSGNGGVAKGTFYVVDSTQNRIQRFSPTGSFERTWGQNVLGRDEKQTITLNNATGGSFTLSFNGNTTAAIKVTVNASGKTTAPTATAVQTALTAAAVGIGIGNVSVSGETGGPYTVRFIGTLGGTDVSQLIPSGAELTGPTPSVTVATTENGSGGNSSGFELCTVAASCQDGLATATTANGGDMNNPQGIAVNQANGHVYVADRGNNRIQEFDAEGNFVRVWGADVGTTVNETQTVTVKATGGKFKLALGGQETAELAFNATAATVQSALTGLTTIGSGNATVSGGPGNETGVPPYTVTFVGALAGTDVAELVATNGPGSPLTGGAATVAVATTQNGSGGSAAFETCTVAANCKSGVAGAGVGQFGSSLGALTADSSNNIWVPDSANNRVQEFDSSGNFLKMVGGDVISDGAEGTGTLSTASTTVSSLAVTSRFFEVGQTVTAAGGQIPAGTTVTACSPSCPTATSLTLSKKPTANVTGVAITAAPGAGNAAVNEKQTITLPGVTGGSFNLAFNGQSTGAFGTGTYTKGSNVVTGVTTTSGTYVVGQPIASIFGVAAGTTITAIDNINHTVTLSNPFAGFGTETSILNTYDVPFNASASTIQSKLEGFSGVGSGNVGVEGPAGGPWVVEFKGKFAGGDVPQISLDGEGLEGTKTTMVTSANTEALEICSVPSDCRSVPAAAGTALGQFSPSGLGGLAFDSSANLYAIDAGNNRVQKFNSGITSASEFGISTFLGLTPIAPEAIGATESGARIVFSVATTNNLFSGEREVVELDPATGSLKDSSLVGLGLVPGGGGDVGVGGLAANSTTGTLYVTTTALASPRRILALSSTGPPAPIPVMSEVATKSSTTATFSGSVDPRNGLVACTFEYSTDQSTWTQVKEPDCDSLAPAGGSQAVSENVTGLVPGTHYYVRLAASRPLVLNSTVNSGTRAFDTDGAPPVITNVGAVQVSDTSARLVGTIDPRNSATAYVFEYGTTPSLGTSTQPVNIGGGTIPQTTSQVISGLAPKTTYYFRLVATNLTGGTASGSKTFTTRLEALPLPDNRAYEQVSPDAIMPVNEGATGVTQMGVALNGEAVSICSIYPDGGQAPSGNCGNDFVIRRTATGWMSKSLVPPFCPIDPETGITGKFHASWFSPNLDQAIFLHTETSSCSEPPIDPAAPMPQQNLYYEDLLSETFDLLSPKLALPFPGSSGLLPLGGTLEIGGGGGASEDFGHIVFQSSGQQTEDAPAGNFDKLFDWDHGVLHLASIKPNGTSFTEGVALAEPGLGGVSRDGKRVFFQQPKPSLLSLQASLSLYVRESASVTYNIGETECTSSCGSTGFKLFDWATPDGSKVLFESPEKLSNEDNDSSAARDLYQYRVSPNPGTEQNLTVLSRDGEPNDGKSADVQGVLGMSDAGNTVFFAAKGQIVPGAPLAAGFKIYRWRWNNGNPSIDYLATLDSSSLSSASCGEGWAKSNWSDGHNWRCSPGNLGPRKDVRLVTPDGKNLMLDTIKALDPVADSDSTRDVYLWDEQDGWRCISCQQPGTPSAGESIIKGAEGVNGGDAPTQRRAPILVSSDDGERLFFTSRDELVPQDTNGTVRDVYEWHDGTVSLISSGTGTSDNALIGTSSSGNDVFFMTDQGLVGWDGDIVTDIYDARVGGGFPEPPAKGAPCEGEACRGAGTSPPVGSGAGSAVFQGPGNQTAPASCPKRTRKVTASNGTSVCKKTHKRHRHKSKKRPQRRAANDNRRTGR